MRILGARSLIVVGGCAAAVVAAPAVGLLAGPAPSAVAQPCAGGINLGLVAEGVPVNQCAPEVPPPVTSGGAPTQEILTQCSGIPGCLSANLYGPGRVQVPSPDTRVRHSQ